MKTLLLLRHAKAENSTGASSDFDRVLNERGRGEARAVGEFIKQQRLKLDLILSSPALRARETTERAISAVGLHCELRFEQGIYEAGSQQLLLLVSKIEPAASSLMLVGHNPALEDLVHMLTGRAEHMSPATLAKISFDVQHWSDVKEQTGTLDWIVKPGELAANP